MDENKAAQALFATLKGADFGPRVMTDDRGGLLLTNRGARVLGIFLDGVDGNLLWTHADLCDPDAARNFVAKNEWNVGGDRCWLAPEIELHFLDPDDPSYERYVVPAEIDPGKYQPELETSAAHGWRLSGRARNTRTQQEFIFGMRRAVRMCAPPLQAGDLAYVGYELCSHLEITSPDDDVSYYGMWQLMQLPAGGTIFVPVRRGTTRLDYFQTGVAQHCDIRSGLLGFPITGQAQHKLGLRAEDIRGRMAYFRPLAGGLATLIIRQAVVFPGAVYADYPACDRSQRSVAIQCYNDGGGFGGFGEMEYHSPVAEAANGFQVQDVSRTWCFAGSEPRVRLIASELLGTEVR